MTPQSFLAAFGLATALLAAFPALAGEGHDHGDAPSTAGPALPRFAAVSETFELVGVLNGKLLTLYLDRFADNSPVKDASLALEIDGAAVQAAPHGEGEFEVVLAEAPKPGVLSVAATVVAGNDTDLLAGELDIHEAAPADAAPQRRGWRQIAPWTIGALLVLGLVVWVGRRAMATRHLRAGAAA